MSLLKRKARAFDMQVQDMIIRVNAPEDYLEESRAAAMQFWEKLHSYSVRHPDFSSSKRPVEVPEDAPPMVREMAAVSARAGVGPVFTFQGAVIDHIGRFLARSLSELTVSSGGDYFVLTRKRNKLTVSHGSEGEGLAIVVDPAFGPCGVYTTIGRQTLPAESVDGLVVLASSCTVADASAAAVLAILSKPNSFKAALAHMQELEGVRGGLVIQGERVGVAGAVEIAA